MPQLFGTAGIRGITNIELTPLFALKIAKSFGIFLGQGSRVAVARDTRYGAQMLQMAIMAGLNSVGIEVHDCGCVPTGTVASYLVQNGLDGAIIVTGSHMPPERIGIIAMLSDGAYVGNETAKNIERIYQTYDLESYNVPVEKLGRYARYNPLPSYNVQLLKNINAELIKKRRFKTAVDACNGTAAGLLSSVLKKLGCEVIALNDTQSPVSGRPPEPLPSTLSALSDAVVRNCCELGIAVDTDADRAVFIDHTGAVVSPDVIGALFASAELRNVKKGSLVVPVNSSGLICHIATRLGAGLHYCRIGQPAITSAMKEHGALFAYEESGKYYFSRLGYWSDGLFSALKLLELLAKRQTRLATLVGALPRFYQKKIAFECPDEFKERVMARIENIWELKDIGTATKKLKLDGVKHIYSDYSWLLVRASGTEPLIRIYADSISEKRVEELIEFGEMIARKVLNEFGVIKPAK